MRLSSLLYLSNSVIYSHRPSFTFCVKITDIFRVKVLVLFLWLAMWALTACRTNWSTSLSTMASALTSCVLVSVDSWWNTFVLC